jgi:hypothetical protein
MKSSSLVSKKFDKGVVRCSVCYIPVDACTSIERFASGKGRMPRLQLLLFALALASIPSALGIVILKSSESTLLNRICHNQVRWICIHWAGTEDLLSHLKTL